MLGLITHEAHFYIIREQVFDFSSVVCRMCGQSGHFAAECLAQDRTQVHKTKFQFIRIPVLREYLFFEFEQLQALPYYDFERIVDDFVLLLFFVGNDFLPHMPSLNIREGGVDSLVYLYKKNFGKMGGYLTEQGNVVLPRVDILMHDLAIIEEPWYKQITERKQYADSQPVRKRPRDEAQSEAEKNELAAKKLIEQVLGEHSGREDPGHWRLQYYYEKFRASDSDIDELVEMVRSAYLHGICWVFQYYYQGCCSWSWFYPYHYAPFASDLHHSFTLKVHFDMGQPFRPFSQLAAVLPPGSVHALPQAYHELVLNPSSVISDFFPEDFALDLNGARFTYQGVILLPFIEERRLLVALEERETSLTQEERRRNEFGHMLLYQRSRHVAEVTLELLTSSKNRGEEDVTVQAVTHPSEAPHSSRLLPGAVEPPNVLNRQLFESSDRASYSGNSQIAMLQKYLGPTEMHVPLPQTPAYFSESYNNNRGICKEPVTKQAKTAPQTSLLSNLLKLQTLLAKKPS